MATMSRDQYDAFAEQYDKMAALPHMMLENELIVMALKDCTNARVLDLGGGSGKHARNAIAAGASVVDLVDTSAEMMSIARMTEEQEHRNGKMNFYLGDITKSLDHLGLKKRSYDIVMANWVFDHATCVEDLDGMWRNIADYVKPGGKFLGVRVNDIVSEYLRTGKYGVIFDNVKEIPGGLAYDVVSQTEPPLSFPATSMDLSFRGSREMHEKYGFGEVTPVPVQQTSIVGANRGWWQSFTEKPFLTVETAVKR